MLILDVCRPGDTLADVPLFEEQDAGYPAHARTTRDSEILFLPRVEFVDFLKTHPQVAWKMLQSFAARMKDLTLRLEGVTLREVSSRLARYLLREMEAGGVVDEKNPMLTLPLAKGSVASYLGTVHETRVMPSGRQRLVVAYSAVIYDVRGATWVYTSPAPNTFVRARIEVDYIDGELAILNDGPSVGTQVVTVGGGILHGTEFGVGH